MPRYDYECLSCGHVFELRQSFDADPRGVCPLCEGTSRRKFHPVPIIYKGSGFYVTDYKQSGSRGTTTEAEGVEKEKDSKKSKAATAADAATDSKDDKKEVAKGA